MDDQETFGCGCKLEPQRTADYCKDHRFRTCHAIKGARPAEFCPACRRAKLLSVNLSRKAVPTRKAS